MQRIWKKSTTFLLEGAKAVIFLGGNSSKRGGKTAGKFSHLVCQFLALVISHFGNS